MGFRYRKSISLGHGFRINISKSGVGYSWGTKGYRITKTSTGRIRKTYSLYGTGLSYVEEYSTGKKHSRTTASNEPKFDIASANIENFQSAEHMDIIKRITCFLRWNMFFTVLLWFVVLGIISPAFLVLPAIGMIGKVLLRIFGKVKLDYYFDDKREIEYKNYINAWLDLNKCHKLWQVTTQRFNRNLKMNAGSGRSVSKEKIRIKKHEPFYIKTNLEELVTIKLKGETLIFLPDKLIIVRKTKAGAISYSDIHISVRAVQFIEDKSVPRDAAVLSYTWRYVNKNGSRDRRYSNNYQLPICQYGDIEITSLNGLNVELQCSDYQRLLGLKGCLDRIN